ncbi:hypothetical protein PI95_008230 [Hassallia byssoidea VB512170]|uniref:Uncharacterized protein n=1 Tax=Hassallia byssoidea VB512170 TaxID=1304833 RepID=A0A846H4K5_9CYAN|nr:hypothetical protein [Hassalia byssoidea]NEU72557.1 hypothetical protein [Hassalia byssoidea VB512170]
MGTIIREELPSIEELRNKFIEDIFKLEILLNSANLNFPNETQQINFIESRTDLSVLRRKLENRILESIATQLKRLESEFKNGIEELEKSIQESKNTVKVIESINKLTGIIARILVIL